MENDVYSFGLILLGLISKHVHEHIPFFSTYNRQTICEWAIEEFKRSNSNYSSNSLAHKTFMEEVGFCGDFATKITEVAMRCLHDFHQRPSMKFFVRLLENYDCITSSGLDYVDGIASDIFL